MFHGKFIDMFTAYHQVTCPVCISSAVIAITAGLRAKFQLHAKTMRG
jgi:hypothetical protein